MLKSEFICALVGAAAILALQGCGTDGETDASPACTFTVAEKKMEIRFSHGYPNSCCEAAQPIFKCLKEEDFRDIGKLPACVNASRKEIGAEIAQCAKDEANISAPWNMTAELTYNDGSCTADPVGSCFPPWSPNTTMSFFGDKVCGRAFAQMLCTDDPPTQFPECVLSLGSSPFCWKTTGIVQPKVPSDPDFTKSGGIAKPISDILATWQFALQQKGFPTPEKGPNSSKSVQISV